MEKILNAEPRVERGKGAARRLRRAGRIPAVVYGHEEPHALSVEAREFHKEFHTVSESTLINLKSPEGDRQVLIKDYEEDILTGNIIHIDFYEVEKGRKVHTRIALELVGSPVGVREGGVLEHSLYEVDIECLPKDLPEHMTVDVSGLNNGESLHISDVTPPPGVAILNDADQTIAAVVIPRAMVESEDEAEADAAAEPTVIGEEKDNEEE
ncbi:MAG: 50S ribosomal protein L25 [Alkalispirochaeta sp.]